MWDSEAMARPKYISTIGAILLLGIGVAVVVYVPMHARLNRPPRSFGPVSKRLLSAYPEPVNISPDGGRILLKSRHLDSFELHIIEGTSAKITPLLSSPHSQFSLTWTPKGDRLLYQEFIPEEGSRGLFQVDVANGTRKKLPLPNSQSSIAPLRFSPDGSLLAYFVHDRKQRLLVTDPAADRPSPLVEWVDADERSDFSWKNDQTVSVRLGSTPNTIANLHIGDPRQDLIQVGDGTVFELRWNETGTELAITARASGDDTICLYSYRAGAIAEKVLCRPWDLQRIAWVPGKREVIVHENNDGRFNALKVTFDTGAVMPIFADDTDREVLRVLADGLLYMERSTLSPPRLMRQQRGHTHTVYATPFSPLPRYSAPRHVSIPIETGKLPALLWRADAPGPRKVILEVHGGPKLQTKPAWNSFQDVMLRNGIDVLALNYRGSLGYGKRFEDAGTVSTFVADTRAAIRYLESREGVALENIFLLGRSFGGAIAVDATRTLDRPPGGLVLQSSPLTDARGLARFRNLPLLVFGGGYDQRVRPENNLRILRAELGEHFADRPSSAFRVFADEGHDYHRTRSWANYYGLVLDMIQHERTFE